MVNNIMNTKEYINSLEKIVINLSKEFNEGNPSYPYAFGYFVSQMGNTLDELNLSKKQLKVLETRLNHVIKHSGVVV